MTQRTNPITLGEYASPQDCPGCDGTGHQTEIVYTAGYIEGEHEVSCYLCKGHAQVIELICGRCGTEDHTTPTSFVSDHRICSCCGHEAPNYLWLPMKHTLIKSA